MVRGSWVGGGRGVYGGSAEGYPLNCGCLGPVHQPAGMVLLQRLRPPLPAAVLGLRLPASLVIQGRGTPGSEGRHPETNLSFPDPGSLPLVPLRT